MNFSYYPPNEFTSFTKKPFNNGIINKQSNCMNQGIYRRISEPNVVFGNNKPINEGCTSITGVLNYGPSNDKSFIWNNLTRRKSLVKD
tara:strand:+ start:250 stop:513 length:264 start_codon:yes stop_codon:yes gene_type:complete